MSISLSAEQIKKILAKAVAEAGSQAACAKNFGVSTPYLHDCLNGKRRIGKSIAAPLGYKPVTVYVPLKESGKHDEELIDVDIREND